MGEEAFIKPIRGIINKSTFSCTKHNTSTIRHEKHGRKVYCSKWTKSALLSWSQ